MRRLTLRFVTGSPGGNLHPQALALKDVLERGIPGLVIELRPGATSVESLQVLAEGGAELGQVKNWQIGLARRAEDPYDCVLDNVLAVANYGSLGGVFHCAVQVSARVATLDAWAACQVPLRVSVPPATTSSYHLTRFALGEHGITLDDVRTWGGEVRVEPHAAGVAAMREGRVDALCGSDYLPARWIADAGSLVPMRLLGVGEDVVAAVVARYGVLRAVIPGGTYPWLSADVTTVKDLDVLAARSDVPEDVVHGVAKVISGAADQIRRHGALRFVDPGTAWRDVGPLHPGAARYYREAGVLRP